MYFCADKKVERIRTEDQFLHLKSVRHNEFVSLMQNESQQVKLKHLLNVQLYNLGKDIKETLVSTLHHSPLLNECDNPIHMIVSIFFEYVQA